MHDQNKDGMFSLLGLCSEVEWKKLLRYLTADCLLELKQYTVRTPFALLTLSSETNLEQPCMMGGFVIETKLLTETLCHQLATKVSLI